MVDYIKFKLDPNKYWDLFYNKEKYHLESVTDMTDGLEKYIHGSHRNLKLHLSRSQIIVSGSLHKFYNDMMGKGNQNYTQFSFMEIASAIDMMENEFYFRANDAQIQNLEIGVNIELSIPPTIFLQENLIVNCREADPLNCRKLTP